MASDASTARGATERAFVAKRGPLSADERNTISIFESVSSSVVYITTVQYVRDFFSRNVMRGRRGRARGSSGTTTAASSRTIT